MGPRSIGSRRFAAASILLFALAAVCGVPAAASDNEYREAHCASAQSVVTAFYSELNAGAAKEMTHLANKGEAAAVALISCAHNSPALPVMERDRLRVRAADALFIAADARYRTAQTRRQFLDLKQILRLIGELDPAAHSSNEHLYQEARLLERFTERIIGKVQS